MLKLVFNNEKVFLFCFLLLTFFVFVPSKATAERASDFKSFMEIKREGIIRVKEEIIITPERNVFSDKFTRYFPKILKNRMLSEIIEIKYNVIEVRLNGIKEKFSVNDAGEYLEVSIPRKRGLSSVPDFYEIEYDVIGAITSFNDFDAFELYATDDYILRIAKVSVVVTAPEGIVFFDADTYISNSFRKKESSFATKQISDNVAKFGYDRALLKGDNMIISLRFSKGINVPAISFAPIKNPMPYVRIMIITIFIYYLIMWYVYGKDEDLGEITPTEKPSLHLTVGKASAIYYGRSFNLGKSIAAEIFSLAKKGYISIYKTAENKVWIKRTKKLANKVRNEEEQILLRGIFERSNEILLEKDALNRNKTILSLRDTFTRYKKVLRRFKDRLIKHNPLIMLIGLGIHLSFAVYFSFKITGWFLFFNVLCGLYVAFFYVIFTEIRVKEYLASSLFLLIVGMHSFRLCPKFFDYYSCDMDYDTNQAYYIFFMMILSIIFLFIVHMVFYHIMDKPNLAAIRILTELESVREFILNSKKLKLSKITAKVFEDNLPYAVIFGLEGKWQNDFSLSSSSSSYVSTWNEGRFDENLCANVSEKIEDAVDFIIYESAFNKIKKRKRYGKKKK